MSEFKNKIERGIMEFYLNSDIEFIEQSLREEGVDVEKEILEISKFVKRLKFTQIATTSKKSNQVLMEKIVEKFQEGINKNIDKPITTLMRLIENREMSVQFRNLEKLTPKEIKEIIKGKNLVDLMDELDNGKS